MGFNSPSEVLSASLGGTDFKAVRQRISRDKEFGYPTEGGGGVCHSDP